METEPQSSESDFGIEDAILVQITRCYDALMLLLKNASPDEAAKLSILHEQGGVMSPAISLDPDKV